MREEDEIQSKLDAIVDAIHDGTRFPAMTYEQGLMTALEWVLKDPDVEDIL